MFFYCSFNQHPAHEKFRLGRILSFNFCEWHNLDLDLFDFELAVHGCEGA